MKKLTNRLRQRASWLAVMLGVLLLAVDLYAQTPGRPERPAPPPRGPQIFHIFYLTHMTQQNEQNDVATELRNMLPLAKVYCVAHQAAISVLGTSDEIALATEIVTALDRPQKAYRLTYTVTETSPGKPAEAQHFALIAVDGQKLSLKQGSRVPIATGTSSGNNTNFQYVDVGLKIEATVEGTTLRSNIEQSSVAQEKPIEGVQEPIIRQATLQDASPLPLGSPVVLGSLDIPGSAQHLEVSVSAERVK